MLKRKYVLVFILILSISCTIPGFSADQNNPGFSIPIFQTPTQTPTPLPTPTPTPRPIARIHQGDWALFLGDYELALVEYQTAMGADPDPEIQAAALLGIGRTYYLDGKYDLAIQTLNSLITQYPQSEHLPKVYYFLGQCAEALQDYAGAASAYDSYLKYNLGIIDGFIYELRGDALVAAGDPANAIPAYEAALLTSQPLDTTNIRTKIGKAYVTLGDHNNAIRIFMDIYTTTTNDYVKAQMNLLAGQSYLAIGLPDQTYARYQDSVLNYPMAYDSYTGLVELVNNGIAVDDLNRGIVDYYAQQYGVALDAFNRYLNSTTEHDGTVHHYKALSHRALQQYPEAITEWNLLIKDHVGDSRWVDAWEEIAYTEWFYQDLSRQAAETLLSFINGYPTAPEAPDILFDAARMYERGNLLAEAAATWARVIDEYPTAQNSIRSLFLSGISYYRMADYLSAQNTFQRLLVLAATPSEQSMAYFWIAKSQLAQNDVEGSRATWETCVYRDPSGYYSERARAIISGEALMSASVTYDLGYDLKLERADAENWMRTTFNIPPETDLTGLGVLAADPNLQRGNAYWDLGLYEKAHVEFEKLRQIIQSDAVSNFLLLDHLLELGLYRLAILSSRQILDLASLDDAATLTAPVYFNHIRFGIYFRDIILPEALSNGFHPLLVFSIIRQESMFEGFIESVAGARGLLQLMPATAQETVTLTGFPDNYSDDDLYKPVVNIPIGLSYLVRQRDYFDNDIYAALTAYNAGPGNSILWKDLSNGDPDLFLEIIRFNETRQYIIQISEFLNIYRMFYERNL